MEANTEGVKWKRKVWAITTAPLGLGYALGMSSGCGLMHRWHGAVFVLLSLGAAALNLVRPTPDDLRAWANERDKYKYESWWGTK